MLLPANTVSALLKCINEGSVEFSQVIDFIDEHYRFTPVAFHNGRLYNPAGKNSGSCRVFAFARSHKLNELQTLSLFCEHYQSVLDAPKGEDHANIREFNFYGWQGFIMEDEPLTPRPVLAGQDASTEI